VSQQVDDVLNRYGALLQRVPVLSAKNVHVLRLADDDGDVAVLRAATKHREHGPDWSHVVFE